MKSWRWLPWAGLFACLIVVLGAVLIQAEGSVQLTSKALSTSLLRGLSMLAPTVLNGWFLLLIAVTPLALRLLREVLPRAQRVEVGQIKVQFSPSDLADLAFAAPADMRVEQLVAIPRQEMAGTAGPIADQPPTDPAYHTCMARLPGLFRDLRAENMAAKAQELMRLEDAWEGEYAPELKASVTYLRTFARRNRVQLKGYLSITLIFRHLMLFFHGRHEHAAQLVQDLDLLDERDRDGFLQRPAMLWVLLALCSHRAWEETDRLRLLLPAGGLEQQAVAAYTLLARGQVGRAAALAESALADTPPHSPCTALLEVTQGRALLELGRPLEALSATRPMLHQPLPDDGNLAGPLRSWARQVIARAAAALDWPDPLYSLYEHDPEARRDPLVLHALAVLTGRAGQREQARHFLRQAEALIAPDNSGLHRAISETARALQP